MLSRLTNQVHYTNGRREIRKRFGGPVSEQRASSLSGVGQPQFSQFLADTSYMPGGDGPALEGQFHLWKSEPCELSREFQQ